MVANLKWRPERGRRQPARYGTSANPKGVSWAPLIVRESSAEAGPRVRSGGHYIFGDRPGFGDRLAVFTHAREVQGDRVSNQIGRLGERSARCDAARKIRDVRAVAGGGLLEKYGVFHFNPACLR